MINERILEPKVKPLKALPPPAKAEVNWVPRNIRKGSQEEAYFRLMQAVYFHTYMQFVANRPYITDKQFDDLWAELHAFESEFPELIDVEYSPAHRIIYDNEDIYPKSVVALAKGGWRVKCPVPYAWRGQTR